MLVRSSTASTPASTHRKQEDTHVGMLAANRQEAADRFLQAVRDEMGYFIRDVMIESCPPLAEPFTGFTIRH